MSTSNVSKKILDASALQIALDRTNTCWLKENNSVCYEGNNIVHRNGYVTLKYIDEQETRVAEAVMEHVWMSDVKHVSRKQIDFLIDKFIKEKNHGYELHIHQRDAVHMAVNNSFFMIIGGPGTGKTTVLNCIKYVLHAVDPNLKLVFNAPTGKAARRVNESTGENAKTFHSQMKLFDEDALPSEFNDDMLVVDEASMMDLLNTDKLFQAVKSCKRIAFIGDDEQLPSVGRGTILRDLINSHLVPCTRLTKTFRQDTSSTLYTNITNIAEGKYDLVKGSDFAFERLKDNSSFKYICLHLKNLYFNAIEKYGIENVVLLLPYRKYSESTVSSEAMNNTISAFLWAGQKVKKLESVIYEKSGQTQIKQKRIFRKGDYVMQLKNRKECANGEVGKIIFLNDEKIIVNYGTRPGSDVEIKVTYQKDELEQLTLAYAMSVNKSQGSEYAFVIMCLLNQHKAMLNKNILYTGITRAKKGAYLLYQEDAYKTALVTSADEKRYSFLVEKMLFINCGYKAEKAVNHMLEMEAINE